MSEVLHNGDVHVVHCVREHTVPCPTEYTKLWVVGGILSFSQIEESFVGVRMPVFFVLFCVKTLYVRVKQLFFCVKF